MTGIKKYGWKIALNLKACADNDAVAAKMPCWHGGGKNQSVAIAEQSDAGLRDEILHLNQVLYGKATDQWQGKKLYQAFVENKAREKIVATDDDQLEPLYRL
jgi:hypothetical protein